MNEYDQLLDYLEEFIKKPKPVTEKNKAGKEKPNKEIGNYQDLHSDGSQFIFTENQKQSENSKGFSVSKFYQNCNKHLFERYKAVQDYIRPYVSITELTQCLRKNYFYRLKYSVNPSDVFNYGLLFLIQEVGNQVHDAIQRNYDFSETEKTIKSEKYKVKGRVDAVKKNFLYEIKTLDAKKFNPDGKDTKAHFKQGNIGAFILNEEYGFKIDTITIIYVFRDLKKIIPLDFEYNKKSANELMKLAPYFKNCLEVKKIPDPINSNIDQCRWCEFKKYCDKNLINKKEDKKDEKDDSVFLLS